jgi:predicted transcriptional regulator
MPDDTSVRLSFSVSGEIAKALEQISRETDQSKTAIIRDAIALIKLAHEEKQQGRHLGFASDKRKLETVVVSGSF